MRTTGGPAGDADARDQREPGGGGHDAAGAGCLGEAPPLRHRRHVAGPGPVAGAPHNLT